MTDLTKRQQQIYDFMQEHFVENHRIPSITQIQSHVGYKSANSAFEQLHRLAAKGYLEKTDTVLHFRFAKLEVGLIEI